MAARCVLTADRRSVPGESFDSICEELQTILEEVVQGIPGLETEIRRFPGGMATLEQVALRTREDEPVVVAATKARSMVCGDVGEFGAFPAWTDGALLSKFGGIPTIVCGPGDLSLAHSPREAIPVAEIDQAAQLYAMTALEFCHCS